VFKTVLAALLIPLALLWKILLRPITIILYKAYIVFGERLKTFFHAQHKLLALITHRFSIHVFVLLLTVTIVTGNVLQAEEVRAEEFADGSLIAQIFRPENDSTITSKAIVSAPTSYIDTSASVRVVPSIEGSSEIVADDGVAIAGGGGAVVKSNVLGVDPSNRDDIQVYEVQGGDTVGTIAEQFGVSTQTILWSNNLSDGSLIQPGDTLYILPTSGIAHTVKSGETIGGIALKYKADEKEILEFNGLIDGSDLAAGDEIIVPGGQPPPPPPPPPTTQLASVRDVFSGGTPAPNAAPAAGGSYTWPTVTRRISQYYGYGHTGIDIDGEFGDPIYAANSGTVSTGWYGGYGLQVLINHGNGTQTRYGHMQKVFVSNGQYVSSGQTLGEMGSTGRSTGSHLHYEVIVGGRTVNPFSYH